MQYTIPPEAPQDAEVLHDVGPKGRVMPWHRTKEQTQIVAMAFRLMDPNVVPFTVAERIEHCADELHFEKDTEGRLRLKKAHFCRVRLCPMCQWRRALKYYGQMRQIVEWLREQRAQQHAKPYEWVLLTLTTKNVPGSELSQELTAQAEAWGRLTKRKEWRAAIQGALRTTEITYNARENTYHPHMHCMLAVMPSYFTGRTYISQERWRALWASAARLGYDPSVDVRRVKSIEGGVAEVAKYATKPSDYIRTSDVDAMVDTLETLHLACTGRRFAAYTGVCRQARQALALDDAEEGDLVHLTGDEAADETSGPSWTWLWYQGPKLYLGGKGGTTK